jgi:integrase
VKKEPLPTASGPVFPSRNLKASVGNTSPAYVLQSTGRSDLTVHGFRSTFRDWAAEATYHANHVVEQALAHAIGSAVETGYRRGDLFTRWIALMDDWARYLQQPEGKVVRGRTTAVQSHSIGARGGGDWSRRLQCGSREAPQSG